MNIMRKFAVIAVTLAVFAGSADAAKWKELVFTDDVSLGMAELTQYCSMHDITVADVLWANSLDSADIKAGSSVYLPASHADMLAIWQHKGAWQPTALIPVTSAAAAKRAAKPEPQPAKTPTVSTLPAPVSKPVEPSDTQKSNDDILAQFRQDVKDDERNLPAPKVESPAKVQPAQVAQVAQPAQVAQSAKVAQLPEPAKPQPLSPAKKPESPAKVIANTAKADKILSGKPKKSAKTEIPGLMDPIIILSPNGDPTKGPMRLVISGDKVEVVQLPKSAAPKRPSLADLNHSFGTNPSYLPHYNMTPKKRDPFILNMGNLAGKMLWPVDGKVSSPFGKWRGSHKHQGIDIPMPAGTPIRAARNGVVSRTGNNSTMGFRGYGNFILMDHGDGLQTFYAHCLSIAVVQGQRVMQGQVIGYVGSTGRSTANHLHFEVRVNSTKVDPIPYLAGNTNLASHK